MSSKCLRRFQGGLIEKRASENLIEQLRLLEAMFTRGEKLATLDRWRQAILAQLAAQGETRRARLLGEIEEARVRLRGAGPT